MESNAIKLNEMKYFDRYKNVKMCQNFKCIFILIILQMFVKIDSTERKREKTMKANRS